MSTQIATQPVPDGTEVSPPRTGDLGLPPASEVEIAALIAAFAKKPAEGSVNSLAALAKGGKTLMSLNGTREFAFAADPPKQVDLCPFCGHNARHAAGVCYKAGVVSNALVAFAAFLTDKNMHVCRRCCDILTTTAELPPDQQATALAVWLAECFQADPAEVLPWLESLAPDGGVVDFSEALSVEAEEVGTPDPKAELLLQRRMAERVRKEALADARRRQEEAQRGGPRISREAKQEPNPNIVTFASISHDEDDDEIKANAVAMAEAETRKREVHARALRMGCPTAGCNGQSRYLVRVPSPNHPLACYAGRIVCTRCQVVIHDILTSGDTEEAKAAAIRQLHDGGHQGPASPTTSDNLAGRTGLGDHYASRSVPAPKPTAPPAPPKALTLIATPKPSTPAAPQTTVAAEGVCWICKINPATTTRNGHPSCALCARVNAGQGSQVKTVCSGCGGEAEHYSDKLVTLRERGTPVLCRECYGKKMNARSVR